jgi:serine/threonine-protein kinase
VGPEVTNAPVREGDVVAGKYRIERTLGSGGMGYVVAARHLALGEPVALKFVLAHHSENREVVERLMREARATFRLRNIHTVRVHDVGELPSGHLYMVMELLEGRDLRAELIERGPLPPSEVVSHVIDTCEALQEAHALGIVHRDLKPGNLFLAKAVHGRDIVKVLDFGMSKLDSALHEGGPLTRPETALGTPRYMAPEQWKSASNVDHTADIWALGVVMYELLTGKTPLHGMPVQERMARLLAGAIPSPRDLRPEVPEELARIVLRCLRADPSARWASVARLSGALRAAFPMIRKPGGDVVEATRTGVTAVVPAEEQARRAALAFDPGNVPSQPATRRETPQAHALPPPSDDYDAKTIVRPPMFTPGDYVAASGDVPVAPPPRMSKTLRSFEASSEVAEVIDQPLEKTLPLAIAIRLAAQVPRPSPDPSAPLASTPPARVPEPPPRKGVAVFVFLAGLATLLVSGLLAWLLVRSLRP